MAMATLSPGRLGAIRNALTIPPPTSTSAEVAVDAGHSSVQDVVVSDEPGDELAFRLFVEYFRRGDLLDAAVLEDGDAIGHGHGFLLIVGHVDDGHPQGPLDAPHLELHLLAQPPVQGSQRFVHQNQARLEHQRPGDGHALLLAAG